MSQPASHGAPATSSSVAVEWKSHNGWWYSSQAWKVLIPPFVFFGLKYFNEWNRVKNYETRIKLRGSAARKLELLRFLFIGKNIRSSFLSAHFRNSWRRWGRGKNKKKNFSLVFPLIHKHNSGRKDEKIFFQALQLDAFDTGDDDAGIKSLTIFTKLNFYLVYSMRVSNIRKNGIHFPPRCCRRFFHIVENFHLKMWKCEPCEVGSEEKGGGFYDWKI